MLADLARFDPLRRAPAGRPKKMPPAHIAPLLWADACRVQRGDEGWGWETVRRKYREVYPISVRWLKRVVQDGSLERGSRYVITRRKYPAKIRDASAPILYLRDSSFDRRLLPIKGRHRLSQPVADGLAPTYDRWQLRVEQSRSTLQIPGSQSCQIDQTVRVADPTVCPCICQMTNWR